MNQTRRLSAILKERGGWIGAKEALGEGLGAKALERAVADGVIERVAHGLYVGADVFPDPFYLAQRRCPRAIFSHETALFLHGLGDRVPLVLTMTIPSGWNTRLLTDRGCRFFYNGPKSMGLGVGPVETPHGMEVRAYDPERTLCDCLRNIHRLDRDIVLTALKRYARGGARDNKKMLDYAALLNIRGLVHSYLEVLA